ncbi:uncharacterized protein EV422DRAFT_571176 [Fimicolochytrium jonesii]|uniref:uncharacterized protein n=1 Tax=Fimicolochytrium jonesii TaxID=1396493 RepID=UPI0022FDF942|nr:uncharacterized protein EV422DRAFT_571176 [Fimicolochytrium jonesii]KAI8817090.1 hypothetical protein EV422DRAFT_571176 [Fimicolochytrium jonesii]
MSQPRTPTPLSSTPPRTSSIPHTSGRSPARPIPSPISSTQPHPAQSFTSQTLSYLSSSPPIFASTANAAIHTFNALNPFPALSGGGGMARDHAAGSAVPSPTGSISPGGSMIITPLSSTTSPIATPTSSTATASATATHTEFLHHIKPTLHPLALSTHASYASALTHPLQGTAEMLGKCVKTWVEKGDTAVDRTRMALERVRASVEELEKRAGRTCGVLKSVTVDTMAGVERGVGIGVGIRSPVRSAGGSARGSTTVGRG